MIRGHPYFRKPPFDGLCMSMDIYLMEFVDIWWGCWYVDTWCSGDVWWIYGSFLKWGYPKLGRFKWTILKNWWLGGEYAHISQLDMPQKHRLHMEYNGWFLGVLLPWGLRRRSINILKLGFDVPRDSWFFGNIWEPLSTCIAYFELQVLEPQEAKV